MHRSIVFLPALLLLASSADAFLGVAQRPALRSVVAPRAAACASSRASMSAEPRDSRRALLQQVGSAAAAVVLAPLSARAEDVMSPADLPALESGVTESGVKYDIVRYTNAPGDKVGFVEIAGKEDAVIVQMLAKKKSTGEVIMDTKTDGKGFLIKMGKKQMVQGLEDGIVGMKAGEQRRLLIPKGELTKPIEDDLEIFVEYERKSNLMKFF